MQGVFIENLKQTFDFLGGTAHLQTTQDNALRISLPYNAVYGGGERFNTLNLKGHRINIKVEEKFCEQFDKSYCVTPFFVTDNGFGFFADTGIPITIAFADNSITLISLPIGTPFTLFTGSMANIIAQYLKLVGSPTVPPKWAFMPWISANHWDSQAKVEEQSKLLQQHGFEAGVIVLEAWSDEATFYIFNEASYTPRKDGSFTYTDFTFKPESKWPNPKAMIEKLHSKGLHLVLWQIPVYKTQNPQEQPNAQLNLDRNNAIEKNLCVRLTNGSPYTISKGNWFEHSMIPDFTNQATCTDWFAKRQYLLEIGVDGFKTDGGEFIYRTDLKFANETDAKQMQNRYAQSYVNAYRQFLTPNQVLFSRAGFTGASATPILWAGDQKSTFGELKSQLRAGLSSAISGLFFWGYDIAGFAGPMPNADLYLRATQMACFCPIMQWHSEPFGGQFKELMPSDTLNNERSPWNVAAYTGDTNLLERVRFYHTLRKTLLPYIYTEAQYSVKYQCPLMYPLVYRYASDEATYNLDTQFMLGRRFLIAPILTENSTSRSVYLPQGLWQDYWSKQCYTGQSTVQFNHPYHIGVFVLIKGETQC